MQEPPKILLLFVHGFLGSESSFGSFPLDLVLAIRTRYRIARLEARIFPFFATKGDPEKAINHLYNWLLLNAAVPEYEGVILCGHSMGGLISTDAFRKILKLNRPVLALEEPPSYLEPSSTKSKHLSLASASLELHDLKNKNSREDLEHGQAKDTVPPETASEAATDAWYSGWWTTSNGEEEKNKREAVLVADDTLESFPVEAGVDDKQSEAAPASQPLESGTVKILAILAFDSPFYGKRLTAAYLRPAIDHIISQYVPSAHADTVKSTLRYGNSIAASTIEALPQVTSNAVSAIPQVTSDVASTIALPLTNPRKAAEIITYPIRAAATSAPGVIAAVPGALSSAASSVPTLISAVPGALTSAASYASSGVGALSSSLSSLWNSTTPKASADSIATEAPSGQPDDVKDLDRSVPDAEDAKVDGVISQDLVQADDGPARAELLPIPQDRTWSTSSLVVLGLTTASIAGGAYYSGGLLALGGMTLVKRAAAAYGLSQANYARENIQQHLSFLYPIWGESQAAVESRVAALTQEMAKGHFFTRVYYIALDEKRTFIKPPPPSSSHIFKSIGSDFDNEIAAHMHMFSRQDNAGNYWPLIDAVGRDIRDIILQARDPGYIRHGK
ncbi:hypothetical protein HDU91_007179 [Kappamyces sp. JEL0680]|nr:hypothetical protein HDU91_007179 [Kappamyces sp. JEL0680]